MLTIAGLTFREVLSKKVFYIVLALTALFLVVYGIALHFTVADIKKWGDPVGSKLSGAIIYSQLLSLGFYFSTFIVALMTVFSAVGSVSGEIETGTIQAVITRPIQRWEYIIGKLAGSALMMSAYAAALYLTVIGITKYITGYQPSNILPGLVLFLMVPLLLLALSLCGSCLMSTLANGITVFMLYIIGMVGGMVEQIGIGINNGALVNIGILSSLVMPSDAVYRKMVFGLLMGPDNPINTFTFNPFSSSSPPSDIMTIYTMAYIVAVIQTAVLIFNRRDI